MKQAILLLILILLVGVTSASAALQDGRPDWEDAEITTLVPNRLQYYTDEQQVEYFKNLLLQAKQGTSEERELRGHELVAMVLALEANVGEIAKNKEAVRKKGVSNLMKASGFAIASLPLTVAGFTHVGLVGYAVAGFYYLKTVGQIWKLNKVEKLERQKTSAKLLESFDEAYAAIMKEKIDVENRYDALETSLLNEKLLGCGKVIEEP